ncbi:Ribosomal protein L25/L23 [Desulfovibrio sp. X2]|uniref:50S ribosomal protein L23 n=1 Tax=Desulfovibrio sp. X2 TaxID=941449 RepID=UPI0003588887|nr:50S ribosomal protein L23 [Desulfovibrio sp. X2]EPR42622.1 Ribosomal protein L25/L23 [Desulfovibrio sp. X2]
MDYTQILLRPVISEKATFVKEEDGQVIFYVHDKANKIEIRKAVEDAFKVKVTGVNVVRRKPMPRTKFGKVTGKVPGFKKAYVTLAEGDKIELFEGV